MDPGALDRRAVAPAKHGSNYEQWLGAARNGRLHDGPIKVRLQV